MKLNRHGVLVNKMHMSRREFSGKSGPKTHYRENPYLCFYKSFMQFLSKKPDCIFSFAALLLPVNYSLPGL